MTENRLEKFNEILTKNMPPLIERELFKNNNLLIPTQMNPLTESNLKYTFCYALDSYDIDGEVSLKNYGKIDLVCNNIDCIRGDNFVMKDENSTNIGIEFKDDLCKINKKDRKYIYSQYFNHLYFAAFGVNNYEWSIDTFVSKIYRQETTKKQVSKKTKLYEHTNYDMYKYHLNENQKKVLEEKLRPKYKNNINFDAPNGLILYNPLGRLWIPTLPEILYNKSREPVGKMKEFFICSCVWKYFKNKDYLVASESELPNAKKLECKTVKRKKIDTIQFGNISFKNPSKKIVEEDVQMFVYTGHYRIDITAMPKAEINSSNPSTIIGIECKYLIKNNTKLVKQLKSYLNSGDISHLYLAVPENSQIKKAIEFLHLNSDIYEPIGILAVRKDGKVSKIKEARRLSSKTPKIQRLELRHILNTNENFEERIYTESI